MTKTDNINQENPAMADTKLEINVEAVSDKDREELRAMLQADSERRARDQRVKLPRRKLLSVSIAVALVENSQ